MGQKLPIAVVLYSRKLHVIGDSCVEKHRKWTIKMDTTTRDERLEARGERQESRGGQNHKITIQILDL